MDHLARSAVRADTFCDARLKAGAASNHFTPFYPTAARHRLTVAQVLRLRAVELLVAGIAVFGIFFAAACQFGAGS